MTGIETEGVQLNYLAHLYLANELSAHPLNLLGAILGDFVKGPIRTQYSPILAAGIKLHRQIDCYTDDHDAVISCRRLFAAPQRRFAGIIVDLCFDHFLSLHWQSFSKIPRQSFIEQTYTILSEHYDLLPQRLKYQLPWMIGNDWLGSYYQLNGVVASLQGMARRNSRIAPLGQAEGMLAEHYLVLQEYFFVFFPDVVAYVRENDLAPT